MQSTSPLPRRFALGLACFIAGCAGTSPATAETPYDPAPYAAALAAHVDENGRVDYAALVQDRAGLDQYVNQLATLKRSTYESWTTDEQIAFWMNAYNALTLKAVVDHYPVDSIKDIGSLFKSVWDKLTFTVMGETLTLNNIEHDILRKDFKEPRIHMAINCASIGCPPLAAEPLKADALEAQFSALTRRFLATPTKFAIDRGSATVRLSPIFKWFGDDFIATYDVQPRLSGLGPKENAVLRFIAPHLDEGDRAYLNGGSYSVDYLDYDWGLNEQ